MTLWTLKEVTKMIGVTESALRYYNAKGILSPSLQESSGRRQWRYDDEDVRKLKKLMLLKHLGLSTEMIGTAIRSEETYRRTIMESLEELRKARDKLNRRIFVAEMLAVSMGRDLFEPDGELSETEAAILNEVIWEMIRENAEKQNAAREITEMEEAK